MSDRQCQHPKDTDLADNLLAIILRASISSLHGDINAGLLGLTKSASRNRGHPTSRDRATPRPALLKRTGSLASRREAPSFATRQVVDCERGLGPGARREHSANMSAENGNGAEKHRRAKEIATKVSRKDVGFGDAAVARFVDDATTRTRAFPAAASDH